MSSWRRRAVNFSSKDGEEVQRRGKSWLERRMVSWRVSRPHEGWFSCRTFEGKWMKGSCKRKWLMKVFPRRHVPVHAILGFPMNPGLHWHDASPEVVRIHSEFWPHCCQSQGSVAHFHSGNERRWPRMLFQFSSRQNFVLVSLIKMGW